MTRMITSGYATAPKDSSPDARVVNKLTPLTCISGRSAGVARTVNAITISVRCAHAIAFTARKVAQKLTGS